MPRAPSSGIGREKVGGRGLAVGLPLSQARRADDWQQAAGGTERRGLGENVRRGRGRIPGPNVPPRRHRCRSPCSRCRRSRAATELSDETRAETNVAMVGLATTLVNAFCTPGTVRRNRRAFEKFGLHACRVTHRRRLDRPPTRREPGVGEEKSPEGRGRERRSAGRSEHPPPKRAMHLRAGCREGAGRVPRLPRTPPRPRGRRHSGGDREEGSQRDQPGPPG